MIIDIPYYDDLTRISNSNIGQFIKKGPAYLKTVLDGTAEKFEAKFLDKGTMIHMYLLQPEEFWQNYEILDYPLPKSKQAITFLQEYAKRKDPFTLNKDIIDCYKIAYKCDKMSDDRILEEAQDLATQFQDYIQFLQLETKGKKVITFADLNMLKRIKSNVISHKKANELLFELTNSCETYNEFHINWDYPTKYYDIQLQCKSLLDRIIFDHQNKKIILVDIKTTVDVYNFKHSLEEFDYYRQMAYYLLAIHWYMLIEKKVDISDYSYETHIVAIQNNGQNEVRVFSLDQQKVDERLLTISNIISKICWHKANNVWDHSKEYYEGDGSELID